MKRLIDVERRLWGKVKNFATVKNLSLSLAVGLLVTYGLDKTGYLLKEAKGISKYNHSTAHKSCNKEIYEEAVSTAKSSSRISPERRFETLQSSESLKP